jgi:hypothetical protein
MASDDAIFSNDERIWFAIVVPNLLMLLVALSTLRRKKSAMPSDIPPENTPATMAC